jgi:type IV pilus assembly protein PilA
MMNRKGFTLVEIMIVVAIIALLAAIAIPNLLRARLNANEGTTITNMQTISTACQSHWSGEGTLPTTTNDLGAANTPPYLGDTILACAGNSCTKGGYVYSIAGTGVPADFVAAGVPQTYGTTGNRVFCVTADGVVRSADNGNNNVPTYAQCTGYTAV